jgi:3-dehydroquinate dehydratase-2
MERILVLNGPNLNLLGERDSTHYGTKTLAEINEELDGKASELGVELVLYQSNHEGDLIDKIHSERKRCRGIIINAGALTNYSYAIRDALEAIALPVIEVHVSDITRREEWRRESVISPIARGVVIGKGWIGYIEALEELVSYLRGRASKD